MKRPAIRVVAYGRAEPDASEAQRRRSYADSIAAIETWARSHDATIASVAVEPIAEGLDAAGDRVGFLRALASVRDGEADAICIPSLEDLDPEMVVQEFLLGEARGSHVPVVSATEEDEPQLADPPRDVTRALVRRVIDELPRFQGEMRSLRAWARRMDTVDGLDEVAPALAALEDMQEHGGSADLKGRRGASRPHRLANKLRLRRV